MMSQHSRVCSLTVTECALNNVKRKSAVSGGCSFTIKPV